MRIRPDVLRPAISPRRVVEALIRLGLSASLAITLLTACDGGNGGNGGTGEGNKPGQLNAISPNNLMEHLGIPTPDPDTPNPGGSIFFGN